MRNFWRNEWNAATNRTPPPAPPALPAAPADQEPVTLWGHGAPPAADQRQQFIRNYEALLRSFLTQALPDLLPRAAALGQRAITLGLGLLDLLQIHRAALTNLSPPATGEEIDEHQVRAADEFLLQALAPYETAFRELQVANSRLRYRLLLLQQRGQRLAAATARQQADISQHTQAEAALQAQTAEQEQRFTHLLAMQEELKKLCTQVLMLHEAEQKRLSLELERSVGGWLDVVDDALQAIAAQDKDPRRRRQLAGPCRQLRRAAKAARQLAEELYPPVLDNMSLAFGLRECLTAFQERTGARAIFHCSGNFQRVDSPSRLVLYRIAREIFVAPLLTGPAARVDMSLRQVNGSIQMQIKLTGQDDPPPDATAATLPGESQFVLLQERVRLLNGVFTADTDSGKTATIRVELPLAAHPRDPRTV